nr:hypothetical protein [Tanacetum cinerariifolium]
MPFHSESEIKGLLAIPTPPLSPILPTSYSLPPFFMPLPIFTPLPTSSFPLPLSLPSTSGSESIPEADIPLWKRARFTTPTGGYEVGESSVAATARQIRHAVTVADRRRADDRLIDRLRRERSWTTASHKRFIPKMEPRRTRTTRANPDHTSTTTTTEPMTQEAINNLIAQRVTEAPAEYETQQNSIVNGDTSHTTRTGPRTESLVWLDGLREQNLCPASATAQREIRYIEQIVEAELLTPTTITTTTGGPQRHIKEFLLALSVELK